MKRINLLITDKQHAFLKEKAVEMEVSLSEQIRRALNLYLKEEKKEAKLEEE